jgi:hypothetical protein
MSFDIEIVSEEDHDDYEVWTCKKCGWSCITGSGGDVCGCPRCIGREESD